MSMIVSLLYIKPVCKVFAQWKAKPAKPSGILELDHVRLAGWVGFGEHAERWCAATVIFSDCWPEAEELLQCIDSGNEAEKEEAQLALEFIQVGRLSPLEERD